MSTTQNDDQQSRYKLAQLWHMYRCYLYDHHALNNVLKEDFNVNYRMVTKCDIELFDINEPHTRAKAVNTTALHMSYQYFRSYAGLLLKRGADVTARNEKNQTVIHWLIYKYELYSSRMFLDDRTIDELHSLLRAQINSKKIDNPRDDNGISHFHAACMTNDVKAMEWFLRNGASLDEAVNVEAAIYAGYTPMHFAINFACLEAARELANRGANVNAKEARGMTPVDLITKRRLGILFNEDLEEVSKCNGIVKFLLEKQCHSGTGFTTLQIACTLKDLSVAESLLDNVAVDIDEAVPSESKIVPGYTAAHFAALNGIDAVKMLAKRGAKLGIADATGTTSLFMCLRRYRLQDMHEVLSCYQDYKGILLSDGKTRLLDFIQAAADLDQFKLFLKNDLERLTVPDDSPLWPGSSVLHLAVILVPNDRNMNKQQDRYLVDECLRGRGVDVDARDARGQTPVHLAFKLGKCDIGRQLLRHLDELDDVDIVNRVDEDNLSYLHIASSSAYDEDVARKLLRNCELPNVAYRGNRLPGQMTIIVEPGFTPLHVAIANGSWSIARAMLLKNGIDVNATDVYGLSPIHSTLGHYYDNCDQYPAQFREDFADAAFRLLLENPVDRVVPGLELSYLHVACVFGHLEAVKQLLELGANVNAAVKYDDEMAKRLPLDLARYSMLTPLACATLNAVTAVIDLLLRRGADVFAESPKGRVLLQNVSVARRFVPYLWDDEAMQKSMEEKLGITKLHVACYMKDEDAVRSVLNGEIDVDVNSRIHDDSVIFAGCTPFHLLMTVSQPDIFPWNEPEYTVGAAISLLLEHGADVTMKNAAGNTPVHVFCNHRHHFADRILCQRLLLNAQADFNINPANDYGVSYFHLACFLHEPEVVEKFLQHGHVDINQPTEIFADKIAGCTPLHLALKHEMRKPHDDWIKLSQTVDLLLKYGANAAAKDIVGNTPLHERAALVPRGIDIFEKLLSYGADINSLNLQGDSPLKTCSFTDHDDFVRILQKIGYQMNCCNPVTGEGYIARIFFMRSRPIAENSAFKRWIASSDAIVVDEMGRTAIHNAVTLFNLSRSNCDYYTFDNYAYGIGRFVERGIDIDHQDTSGETALHYAARKWNCPGFKALLKYGADVNVLDKSGKPVFINHPIESCHPSTFNSNDQDNVFTDLIKRVERLRYLGLEVNTFNRDLVHYADEMRKFKISNELSYEFLREVEFTKMMNVNENSLTLYHFLNDTGIIRFYSFLPECTKNGIDHFFKSMNYRIFKELEGIIKLQFRKMQKRTTLIDSALSSLRTLLGFSFPGLCEEITLLLTYTDLQNVIASTIPEDKEKET